MTIHFGSYSAKHFRSSNMPAVNAANDSSTLYMNANGQYSRSCKVFVVGSCTRSHAATVTDIHLSTGFARVTGVVIGAEQAIASLRELRRVKVRKHCQCSFLS